MIMISAPSGIGEVTPAVDLAELIAGVAAADPDLGGLADGDVVVVTSKIISKAEDLLVVADGREAVVAQESVEIVARRGGVRIARTRHGLVMAAAGVDSSNVGLGEVLPLPRDPDASAARLRAALHAHTGRRLGVIISDTSGRAWRIGQTDIAVGAAGVRAVDRYAGRTDPYGNELAVTAMVLADELAAAADLGKRKLTGRPVAVIRGLAELVTASDDPGEPARALVRPAAEDMFGRGTREAVLAALAGALGVPQAYERWVELDGDELRAAVTEDAPGLGPERSELVARLLAAAAYPG